MSKKLKSDSKWNELTEEQRDTLEGWLFEENLTYREALERAEKEFGITASISSLARWYEQRAKKRLDEEVGGLVTTFNHYTHGNGVELIDMHQTAMTLVGNRLIQIAMRNPGKIKELVSLSRVLLANEAVEVKKRWIELEEERRYDELLELTETRARNKAILDQVRAECAAAAARKTISSDIPTTTPT